MDSLHGFKPSLVGLCHDNIKSKSYLDMKLITISDKQYDK